jgi:uncharacterized protein (DUF2252 family)
VILDHERPSDTFFEDLLENCLVDLESQALSIDSAKRSSVAVKLADATPHRAISIVQNTHIAARKSL